MGRQGPWGDHEPIDDTDERERADLPSGAARWVVASLGIWISIGVIATLIYLR